MGIQFNSYAAKFGGVSEKKISVEILGIKEKLSSTGKRFYTVTGRDKLGETNFFTAFPDTLAKVEATEEDMAPGRWVEIGYAEKPSQRGAPFKNLKSCRPIGGARPAEPKPASQNDLTDAQIDEICGI